MARAVLNDDVADKWTDEQQAIIEKRLNDIYSTAWKELSEKEKDYFEKLEKKDKVKQQELKDGKLTKQDYQAWRLNQIQTDERWKVLRDEMARKMTQTNEIASDYINSKTPEVFAYNHNFTGYQIENATGISFTLVDKDTVKNAVINPESSIDFKTVSVNRVKSYNWDVQKINTALVSGIVQGKSAKGIAGDFYKVMGSDKKSAMRNARTSITSAQNSGRQTGREQLASRLEQYGMTVRKQWVATHDERTRDSHAHLDGEIKKLDEKFSNGLMYPADSDGAPSEVYNCRCTTITIIDGINDNYYTSTNGYTSYQEWLENKKSVQNIQKNTQRFLHKKEKKVIVDDKNLLNKNIELNADELITPQILKAQGFDGLPTLVDGETFENLVNDTKIYIERTYTAKDKETVLEYQKDLYNGKFFVECIGGSLYGHGMYGAYVDENNSDTNIFERIRNAYGSKAYNITESFTMAKDTKYIDFFELQSMYYEYDTNGKFNKIRNRTCERMIEKYIEPKKKDKVYEIASKLVELNEGTEEYKELWRKLSYEIDDDFIFEDVMDGVNVISDLGDFASLLGYDAIKVPDRQYVVVLNRTKCVFKEGRKVWTK